MISYIIFLQTKKVAKSKESLCSKYLLKPDNPIILIGVPQLLEHSILSAKDHWKFQEDLCRESTKTDSNVLLSLHPKMKYDDYKFLQKKYRVKIIKERVLEVLPLSDIYVAITASSTIPLAMLCEKPIITLDPFDYNYIIYDWIKSKNIIKDLNNLSSTLNTMIKDKNILNEIKLSHRSQKYMASPFDGKCGDRIFNI